MVLKNAHVPFDGPFDKPFDKLTVPIKVEGLTALSRVKRLLYPRSSPLRHTDKGKVQGTRRKVQGYP